MESGQEAASSKKKSGPKSHQPHRKRWLKRSFGTVFLLVVFYSILAWVEAGHPIIVLDAITLPTDISNAGITSDILTERTRIRLKDIQSNIVPPYRDKFVAVSDPFQDQLSTSLARTVPDVITVYHTTYKVSFYIEMFRHLRGTDPIHLSSSLVEPHSSVGTLNLSCAQHTRSEPQQLLASREVIPGDPTALTDAIAECYSELVNPYSLGLYMISRKSAGEVSSLADRMLSHSSDVNSIYERAHLLKAILAAKNHDYDSANVEVKAAVDLAPNISFVHSDAAYVFLIEHRADLAVVEAKRAFELAPERCAAVSNLGASLYLMNQFSEARKVLESASSKDDPCASTHSIYGEVLAHDQGFTEAENQFNTAISLEPNVPDYHVAFSRFLQKRLRKTDALEEMQRAIKLSPNDPQYHLEMSYLLHQQKNENGSATELQNALNLNPVSALAQDVRGLMLIEGYHAEDAKSAFTEAIKIDPKDAYAHWGLAYALLMNREPPASLEQIGEAVQIEPRVADFHDIFGKALYASGRFDDSLKEFQTALSIDTENVGAQVDLANLWLAHVNGEISNDSPKTAAWFNDISHASQLLTKALTADPENIDGLTARGHFLGLTGDTDGALRTYEKEMEIAPRFSVPHYEIAAIYSLKGNISEATKQFNQAISLDPHVIYFRLGLAEMYFDTGQYEKARSVLVAAKELDDRDGAVLYKLSRTLFALGHTSEAISLMKESAIYSPTHGECHEWLANMYMSTGQLASAKRERMIAANLMTKRNSNIKTAN